MIARARVEQDPLRRTLYLHVGYEAADGSMRVVSFGPETVTPVPPEEAIPPHLATPLTVDVARAMYEALADHFGHSGNDTRALRKDYDAERQRVDRLIGNLIGGQR